LAALRDCLPPIFFTNLGAEALITKRPTSQPMIFRCSDFAADKDNFLNHPRHWLNWCGSKLLLVIKKSQVRRKFWWRGGKGKEFRKFGFEQSI
jgi:hypothetical protein